MIQYNLKSLKLIPKTPLNSDHLFWELALIIGVFLTDSPPAFIPSLMKAEIEREIQTAVRLPVKGRLNKVKDRPSG